VDLYFGMTTPTHTAELSFNSDKKQVTSFIFTHGRYFRVEWILYSEDQYIHYYTLLLSKK